MYTELWNNKTPVKKSNISYSLLRNGKALTFYRYMCKLDLQSEQELRTLGKFTFRDIHYTARVGLATCC